MYVFKKRLGREMKARLGRHLRFIAILEKWLLLACKVDIGIEA